MARQDAPTVVSELVPQLLAPGQIRVVLQNLVKEQVPIKDLSTILNTLADHALTIKDPFSLTEHVRAALGRKICQRYQTDEGRIMAFILSQDAERIIQGSISLNESGPVLRLDPAMSEKLHENLVRELETHHYLLEPVIVCEPKVRRFVKTLFERQIPKLVVLSYAEIVPGVTVTPLAQIDAS
jgi:flagellar biosynthesis protein FlhA